MILSRLRQLWFQQQLFHPLYRLFFYVCGIQLIDSVDCRILANASNLYALTHLVTFLFLINFYVLSC